MRLQSCYDFDFLKKGKNSGGKSSFFLSKALQIPILTSFTLFLILALPAAGLTQENQDEEGDPVGITTNIEAEHVMEAEIKGSHDSVAYTEYSADMEWLFLLFNMNRRRYDWDSQSRSGSILGSSPFDSLTRISPGLQYYSQFGDKWGLWVRMEAIAGFEQEISSGAWSYNPQLIGIYTPWEHISFYGGIGTIYHKTDDVIYPVLGLASNMDAKEGFSLSLGFPENMLRYGFNSKFALKLDFEWDIRFYRLASNNTPASKGYIRIEDKKPGVHFNYTPIPGLILGLGYTGYLGRSFSVYNQSGNKLSSRDVSESWSVAIETEYSF